MYNELTPDWFFFPNICANGLFLGFFGAQSHLMFSCSLSPFICHLNSVTSYINTTVTVWTSHFLFDCRWAYINRHLVMLGSTRNGWVQCRTICCTVVSTLKQLSKCQNTFVAFAASWGRRDCCGCLSLTIRITVKSRTINIQEFNLINGGAGWKHRMKTQLLACIMQENRSLAFTETVYTINVCVS